MLYQHPGIPWLVYQFGTPQGQPGYTLRCQACGVVNVALSDAAFQQFAQQHAEHRSAQGVGLGDAIAAMTKAVGIAPCSPCEARRRMLNGIAPRIFPRR